MKNEIDALRNCAYLLQSTIRRIDRGCSDQGIDGYKAEFGKARLIFKALEVAFGYGQKPVSPAADWHRIRMAIHNDVELRTYIASRLGVEPGTIKDNIQRELKGRPLSDRTKTRYRFHFAMYFNRI